MYLSSSPIPPKMSTSLARSLHRAQSSLESCTMRKANVLVAPALAHRAIRPGFQRRYQSNKPDNSQKIPLEGYYADILSRPSRSTSDSKPSTATPTPTSAASTATQTSTSSPSPASTAIPVTSTTPTQSEKTDKEEREARARVVFGSRLAGPGRQRELAKGSRMIAGVLVPPRPEEPDNCCMSGCVNCVWDLYRDELEEWAAANAEAKAKMASLKAGKGGRGTVAGDKKKEGRGEVMGEGLGTGIGKVPTHVAVSMDDDGGGSETNWTLNSGKDDLFGGIPVGIREFMRTEKLLKQRHAQEKSLGG
ncbi:Hypothetical protein D9617_6g094700 [Elsinoe fawcettii]|nr:Hypothetical protein D9617_6g094700 [Elsinoe fawcettii]